MKTCILIAVFSLYFNAISIAQEYSLAGFDKQAVDDKISGKHEDCITLLEFSDDTLIVEIITQMSTKIIPEPEETFELINDTLLLDYAPEITIVDTSIEYNSSEMRYDTIYHTNITSDIKNFMRYRLKYKISGIKSQPEYIKFKDQLMSVCTDALNSND